MRVFLTVLILIFAFHSWTKADDLKDFEIEGISIGDSVLDFFNKDEIKKNTWDYFKNKEFTPLQFDNPSFAKTYDAIDIQYVTSDKNFTIMGLSGIIYYTDTKKLKNVIKKWTQLPLKLDHYFQMFMSRQKKLQFIQVLMMEEKALLPVYILNLNKVIYQYNVIIIL